MTYSAQIAQLPEPGQVTLLILGVAFVAFLASGILLERYRRLAGTRLRLSAEWKSAREIMDERDFSEADVGLLERILKDHSPQTPLRAVTTRLEFEHCVDKEMQRLESAKDATAYEKMGVRLREIRTNLGLDYVPLGQQIHSSRELSIGQSVSLSLRSNTAPKWRQCVVEVVDEAYFYLSPVGEGGAVSSEFKDGTELRCRMWREEDARYLFSAKVIGFDTSPPMWRMSHSHNLNRMQARANFRVRHDQTTNVGVLNAPVDGDARNAKRRRVVTRMRGRLTSLSSGGCALIVQQVVGKHVLLRIGLELENEKSVDLEIRIITVIPISGGRYLIRGSFVGLDKGRREQVERYVHQKQQGIMAAETTDGKDRDS